MSTISTLIAQARAFVTTLRSSIWAIDVRNGIGDSIQKLSEAIEQCYSDVSNPTLQTEALEAALQNKIDEGEMAALTIGDGTITAAKLASGVIDNTLVTPGAAADAKTVGDALGEINESLANFKATDLSSGVAWVNGKAIQAGTGASYTSSGGSASAYIDISGCSKIVYMRPVINSTSVPTAGIAFYDSSKTYIANSGIPSANKSGGGNPEINTVDVPEGAVYVRCTYIRTDSELIANYPFFLYDYADYSSTLDAKVGKNTDDITNHGTQITALQEALESVKDNNLVKVEGASMGKSLNSYNGNLTTNTSYNTTGYIDVSGVKYLFLNAGVRYWFYDSEKADGTTGNAGSVSPIYNGVKRISVPDGAVYFRITIQTEYWDSAFIYASSVLDAIFYSIEHSTSGQKVLYTIGDSITKGMYANEGASSSTGPTAYCYAYWIAELNGYELHNLGVSDTGYVATDGNSENNGPDIADDNDFDDADYITIAYGVNDYKSSTNISIGSLAESTLNDGTIIGNMRYTIETIIGKAPQAKLFIISPLNGNRIMSGVSAETCTLANNWYMGSAVNGRTLADIKTAIKAVAEYYGIELIDLQQVGPINRLNIRTLAGDGLHPSITGHEMIGRTLSAFIK